MRTAMRFLAAGALLGLLAVLVPACEDTDIVAPSDSGLSLIASPESVFINQDAGETEGQTTLTAQLVDATGTPLQDIRLFFTSTGGLLDSVSNSCAAGTCSRSGEACVFDSDCPFVPQEGVLTNTNGVAQDVLTLRLIEDPTSVTVTVQTTSLSATKTITKTVNLGPVDPHAAIAASPATGQLSGKPFSFSGAGSTFDPNVDIECWEWKIVSEVQANSDLIRDVAASVIDSSDIGTGAFADDQDLTVTLKVSDRIESIAQCTSTGNPDPALFSQFSATLSYQIRCDFTDPIVDAGNNKFLSFGGQASVTVNLNATASDPERPNNLIYTWDCGNTTQNSVPGASVGCVYANPPGDSDVTFSATVKVENECGRVSTDGLTVTVSP